MENYNASSIKVMEGLTAVRKRPGMYIGSTGPRGLHHLVYEVLDNSIDEALAGHCDKIDIKILEDGSVIVEDNGRGIPVDIHEKYNVSAMEIVMTKLHAGGKFDKDSYKVSGGLHGVGVSVVNALSEFLEVYVHKNGKIYHQKFEKGIKIKEVEIIGDTTLRGTKIRFKPDATIFDTVDFSFDILANRFKELSFLNKKIKISFEDERTKRKEEYYSEKGIVEFMKEINKNRTSLHEPIYIEKENENISIEICIQYVSEYSNNIFSFVNNINTIEGGTHVSGFKTAITRIMNGGLKDKATSDDILEGLSAIISIKLPEPQFEGQTKTKLGNSKVKGEVDSIVNSELGYFFEKNPNIRKKISEKIEVAAKAREAARKARMLVRRKNALTSTTLPGKLSDCSSKDTEKTEIFLVEGDSAGGSAKQARSKEFQAILPLKGKILNVEKSHLSKILGNDEITSMITAFGTSVGEEFNVSKLRYNKIIIMTDADVDGSHISCLLLTFFFRHLKELIEDGHLYKAIPPLYKISEGRNHNYVYSEKEKDKLISEILANGKKYSIQRYKGLGEMNPEQLWETTMDPDARKLKQIKIDDPIFADETFTLLMGEKVEPRKEFIMSRANLVTNLDI